MNIEIPWKKMALEAWKVRENSCIFGKTKVGAVVYTRLGNMYRGCNIEHIYRSHDIHAEINAISNMVSSGENKFLAILVVAERDFFTPCGSCMDWIMQHGEKKCLVGFENRNKEITIFTADELMPHYPK